MNKKQQDWFFSWFDTPYYHILYKDRNDDEAQLFMRKITSFLKLNKNTHILDLPCGKGRHAIFLSSLGYAVTGGDLSKNSIQYAKRFETKNLKFKIKDMRQPFQNTYDAIFNLFTSFGYFDTDNEDIQVLKNMKNGLNSGGFLVLDFLNVELVKKNLVPHEVKTIDGIRFSIKKEIKNGFILKHIEFEDKGKSYSFIEKVKYIDFNKFKDYFFESGFEIQHIFGDYCLSNFETNSSERLILVAK